MVGGDANNAHNTNPAAAVTTTEYATAVWGDVQVKYDGATETRMKNMAWNYIVKNG